MHTVTETHSRDEMIAFGHAIARAFKINKDKRPWMVLLGGDKVSGKCLLALAVDQYFHPRKYPSGILEGIDANIALRSIGSDNNVVFENFSSAISNRKTFDNLMRRFVLANQRSPAVFVSNIARGTLQSDFSDSYDYRLNGLDSDVLDMHIEVRRLPGEFSRRIALTYENPGLTPITEATMTPLPRSRLSRLLPSGLFGSRSSPGPASHVR